MNTTVGKPFRSALISWLILSALVFWFKGGIVPLIGATIGSAALWLLARLAPQVLRQIARISPARLSILLLAVAVSAVAGELVISRIAPQAQVYGWLSRDTYELSPTRWFAHKPNLDVALTVPDYTYRLQTNSLGFRDREHAEEKKSGVTRILLIGDSFTDGDGVAQIDNYPSVMERALADEEGNTDWEIINVSVPGYGPVETALTLDEFAPIYKPDLIIFGFYLGNDLNDAMKSKEEKLREIGLLKDDVSLFPLNNWLWHNSNFYVLLQNALSVIKEKVKGGPTRRQLGLTGVRYFRKDAPQALELGWQITTRSLARMKSMADSLNADLIVALFPLPSQVTPHNLLEYYPSELDLSDTSKYDVNWLQCTAHQKLDSLGIIYVDLTSAYRDSPKQPLFNTIADHHPNRNGYRLMGEYIAGVTRDWRHERHR